MIFQIISVVAISVVISLFASLVIAYIMHRRITVDDIDGLKLALEGKADARHYHYEADIVDANPMENIFKEEAEERE